MSTSPLAPSVRVKICGITSVEDALVAADAGADAIGLVFYEPSPRYVELDVAREIARSVGPFVTVVGLFVDADQTVVRRALDTVGLHVLQFHGKESDTQCRAYGRPYLKALRMKPELDPTEMLDDYPGACGMLLDTYRKGVPGGTGEMFDWDRVPPQSAIPLILAGGLEPGNVVEAIGRTRVYGVDVSGGVEKTPGVKDPEAVRLFVRKAKNAFAV